MSSDDAIQEAFSLFDRDGVSSVSYADVGKAVRSLGYNPTEGELKEFLHQVDGANRYVSLFSAFAKVALLAQVDIPRSVTQTFGTLSGHVCINSSLTWCDACALRIAAGSLTTVSLWR
jgi:hypothetical protein